LFGETAHRSHLDHRADVEPLVTASHLRAPFDEHGAEGPVSRHDVVEQVLIARFEHSQRHRRERKNDRTEREHGVFAHAAGSLTRTMNRSRSLTSPSMETTNEDEPASLKTRLAKVSARTTVRSWPSGRCSGRRTGTDPLSEPGSTDPPSSSWSSTSRATESSCHPHGTLTRSPIPMLGWRAGRERTVSTSHPPPSTNSFP